MAQRPANIPYASFYVNLLSGVTQKASFNRTEGSNSAKSTIQPYWEVGADRHYRLTNTLSYLIGLHITVSGRNTIFDVPIKKINPNDYNEPLPPFKDNQVDAGLALPILIEKAWHIHPYNNIYIQGGIQLHYSLGSDVDGSGVNVQDSNGNNVEVFSIDLNANNQRKPWLTYSLGSGYEWMLKNYNLFKIGIVANLSFTHFVKGNYQIDIPGDPLTQGTYHVTGSYIGIAASYGFTGLNKKMVHTYENEKNNIRQ